MSATYNSSLSTDLDWVRFLIGDTVVTPSTSAMLQDEEITAVIAAQKSNGASGGESSQVYLAAAECLGILHGRFMTKGKGVASRKVSRLTVVYGTGSGINIDIALQNRIAELKQKGARLLQPPPYVFRNLGRLR